MNLDNLFTNTVLFRELRKLGIGACGTTRATSSRDFPELLLLMKDKKHSQMLPWVTLVAIPIDEVLCLGWIDNNTVLYLSTVYTVNKVADKLGGGGSGHHKNLLMLGLHENRSMA